MSRSSSCSASPYAKGCAEKRSALLEDRARTMRFAPTSSEERLWRELSGSRLGVRFVRQAVIGNYLVDFVARSKKLVVEVDGGYHAVRKKADARRDEALRRLDYRVIRVLNSEVENDLPGALRTIREALR